MKPDVTELKIYGVFFLMSSSIRTHWIDKDELLLMVRPNSYFPVRVNEFGFVKENNKFPILILKP